MGASLRNMVWKWLAGLAVIALLAGTWAGPVRAGTAGASVWSELGPGGFGLSVPTLWESGGTLYAGTDGSGVWAWDGSAWSQLGGPAGLTGNAACVVSLTTVGTALYAGADDGNVWAWDGSAWTKLGTLGQDDGGDGFMSVISLTTTVDGAIYAGTMGKGVWAWNGSTWSQVGGATGLQGNLASNVASLQTEVDGTVYAGTAEGVWAWDGSNWSQVGGSGGLAGDAAIVNDLLLPTAGTAPYAATNDGVWAWDGSNWSRVGGSGGLTGDAARVTTVTMIGTELYAGTDGDGVWAWNGSNWSQLGGSAGLTGDAGNDYTLAKAGSTIYAGTYTGVWAWNGSNWSQVPAGSVPSVSAAPYVVGNRTLYAPTGVGVWAWNGSNWSQVNGTAGLAGGEAGSVAALAPAPDNGLYAGTGDGNVWAWDGTQWSKLGGASGLDDMDGDAGSGNTAVLALTTDASNKLYAGTYGAGVWAWNGSTWSQVGPGVLTGSAAVVNTLATVDGTVYAGTSGAGVWAWDGSNWSQLGGTTGLTGNAASVLSLAGVDGAVYAGTYGAGVWAWDGSTWSQLGESTGLTGDAAYVETLAPFGTVLYAGTYEAGVWAWDGSTWSQLGGTAGLTGESATVRGLTTLADGTLYAAGAGGVWAWAPSAPVVDLTCASFTDTTASFSFTAPTGASSVVMEHSTDNGTTWNPATTGALSATSTSATATGLTVGTAYEFKLVVTGGGHAGESNVVDVTTAAAQTSGGGGGSTPALAITTTTLPAGNVGQQYSQTVGTNDEGTAPYTFSVTNGSLPPGLALDAPTGQISGTLTTAGTYAFTVTVKDANSNSASESYSLTVDSAAGTASLSPSVGGTVALGTDASVAIPAGALQGSADVNVTIQSESSTPATPQGYSIVGAYEFTVNGQDHYTFNNPVTLTFTFDPSKVPQGTTPAVYYYDGHQWVLLNGTVDSAGDTITVTVDHFTLYAVMAETQKPPAKTVVTLKDIAGNWAQADIEKLVSLGAITGYPDGTFRPDDDITRAEFVTVLVKALKLTHPAGGYPPKTDTVFADTQGTWAQSYISTAEANSIVSGYDATHFGPQSLITREQMTAMVVRAAKLAAVSGELSFKDAATIDAWAKGDIVTAVKDGIVNGYPPTTSGGYPTFRPLAYATRAEAVTVIAGLLK